MMASIQVFDPAMCCSTGVCGPSVDPKLVRFAADLEWVKNQGVNVLRFNLSQQPADFVADADVKAALEVSVEESLPLVKVEGKVKSKGRYPSRAELAEWAGLAIPEPGIYSDAVAELVAIGAAIASNCEPCFKYHFDRSRKLGVSNEDMLSAVATAKAVKETPAASILSLAERLLATKGPVPVGTRRFAPVASEACCGGSAQANIGACC